MSSSFHLRAAVFAGVLVALLGAAALLSPASGEASTEATPLLAGETGLVESGAYPAVGFVLFSDVGCTGTLIAKSWVLTAAHCVPVGAEHTGQVYLGINDARSLKWEDRRRVDRVVLHPDYRAEPGALERIGHDIALLHLERPATARPMGLAVSGLAARHDSSATMIGFGDTCAGCGADDRLRMGMTTFLGDRRNSALARAFRADFPLVAFTHSNELETQAGICAGDSGGPVIGEVAGHVGIVAVLSNEIFLDEAGRTLSCGGAGYSIGVHVEVAAGTPNGNWIFSTIGGRPSCGGLFATIVGTPGDDEITGTDGRDVIVSGAGDDLVHGGGGRDLICGGPGNDTLRGDAGADIVRGGGGIDSLIGNAGKDRCFGDPSDAMASCERRIVGGQRGGQ